MHWLDLIVYVIISYVWNLYAERQHQRSGGYLQGLDGLFKMGLWLIFTVVYLVIFAAFDLNWSDLFNVPEFLIINDMKFKL